MKSPIRIAYDNLAALLEKDADGMKKAAVASNLRTSTPVGPQQTIEQEVRESLGWQHICELVASCEYNLENSLARLEIAQQLHKEWKDEHESRRKALIELFRMLPEDEQNELMVDKLSK